MNKSQLQLIAQTIFNKKGINILILDVRGISMIADFFIIAEGTADKHIQAISQAIVEAMAQEKRKPMHLEGHQLGEWIVIDFFDTIIHLFAPGFRERYCLEELWHNGKIVNIPIQTSSLKKL